jgi:hypothetical protein
VEVHQKTGAPETEFLIYTVTVLVEMVGVTVFTPEVGTSPRPSIETVVALDVLHVSTD